MLFSFILIGLSLGIVYGLVALGISLVYRGLDIVHFAHGEIFMLGAFVGLVAVKLHDGAVPYWLALLATMVVVGILGVVLERVFYRRLTRGGGGYTVAGMGIIICGFGMSMVLIGTAFLIWGAEHRHYPVEFGPPIFLGDIFLPRSYLWTFLVAVALIQGNLSRQIGERIPDFSAYDQNGNLVSLGDVMGPNGAMVVFHRSADW